MEPHVPTNAGHWIAALSSIVVLLFLLIGLRWKSTRAAPVGMLIAALVAVVLFRTPLHTIATAGGKGLWESVFVLYVIWPAMLLYAVADRAGAFHALRAGILRFSHNELFLVLSFGWVFASFLQGIIGFGVPIAVVAPLLVALGVRPVYAVAMTLIGHAWANMFGTIAVVWLATNQVIDIADPRATAAQTALLLWITNLFAGLTIAWLYGRWSAVRHALPMILIVSLIHGGVQLGLVLWNPIVSNFIAGTIALLALYPLSRWSRYDNTHGEMQRPAMNGGKNSERGQESSTPREEKARDREPVMGLTMAAFPYLALIVVTLGVLLIPAAERALGAFTVGVPFPETSTGYGVIREATDAHSPFAVFTHPGTFILVATGITWVVYRLRGHFQSWARTEKPEGIWKGVADGAFPASVAVTAFMVMATVLDNSGQTRTLALGIATFVPPLGYAFLANVIGVVGAFTTSSNTASNVLLAGLQQDVAGLQGLPEASIIAGQSAGGALGNAIAPANALLGTGTAGIVGREGAVLRKTFPYVTVVAPIVGAGTVLLVSLTA